MAKLKKQAGVAKDDKKARMEKFLADFLAERKKTSGKVSDDDIIMKLSVPISGAKKNRYGVDRAQLQKYVEACKNSGQIPSNSR